VPTAVRDPDAVTESDSTFQHPEEKTVSVINNHLIRAVVVAAAVAVSAPAASAQPFNFAYSWEQGGTPVTSVTVAPNAPFTLRLFLQETGGGNGLNTVGLATMGANLNVGTASSPVSITGPSGIVMNPAFNFPSPPTTGASSSSFQSGTFTNVIGSANKV